MLLIFVFVLVTTGFSSTCSETFLPPDNGDYVIGPDYTIDPDLADKGNPKGRNFVFSMRLSDSKIFNGSDSTLDPVHQLIKKERKIFVYVPSQYKDGTMAPILVIQDGPSLMASKDGTMASMNDEFNLQNVMDNLMASKHPTRRLPMFIAVAIENGSGEGSYGLKSERQLEYDTMSDRYARFVDSEVLPAVLNNPEIKEAYPNIAFTNDPRGRATMGCSSGGAAAFSMGWFRPDLFGKVAAYSGTFVDMQDHDVPEAIQFPFGAWEYHSHGQLIKNNHKKDLRVFHHASENDFGTPNGCYNNQSVPPSLWTDGHHNWALAGNLTAAALKSKGYDYRYVYSRATCHCDGRVYLQTIVDTLVWLWLDYDQYTG